MEQAELLAGATTWQSALQHATAWLESAGVESARVDALIFAQEIAGTSQVFLTVPSKMQLAQFATWIARRAKREPLQHILGKMWFYGLELLSSPAAFIVRPETELVAEAGIKILQRLLTSRLDNTERVPLVLDLCTGSGAIALAIWQNVPRVQIVAVEKSDQAAQVAKQNFARYQADIELVTGDALEVIPALTEQVDLVISNPPYVPGTHELSPEVLQDPALALWGGGADGLVFPLQLLEVAWQYLRPGGSVVMEHSVEQGTALAAKAYSLGYSAVEICPDLTGRDRWLQAVKPQK